jgi:hypothetical protein
MADLLVDCINKKDRNSKHEGITHLGGPGNGSRWKDTRAEVIRKIENGTNTYHTNNKGKKVPVKVRGTGPDRYVQTQADGVWSDNLLEQSECK